MHGLLLEITFNYPLRKQCYIKYYCTMTCLISAQVNHPIIFMIMITLILIHAWGIPLEITPQQFYVDLHTWIGLGKKTSVSQMLKSQ